MSAIVLVALLPSTIASARPSAAKLLARNADDPAALDRLSAQLSPGEVARVLRGSDADAVRAAVAVAPRMPGGLAVLPDLMLLAARASGPGDAALAAARTMVHRAMGAAGEIEPLAGEPRDSFIVAITALAQRADLPAARRAAALELAAHFLRAGDGPERTLLASLIATLLGDRDAELRLAAAELAPDDPALQQRLTDALADPSEPVALAAAMQLCARVPIAILDDAAIMRVRAALTDPSRLVSQLLRLMPCVRAHGAAEDAAALKALKKHRSPSVKKLAAALAFRPR